MLRILVYLFPLAFNICHGGIMFISANRMSREGGSPLAVSCTIIAWAVTYCVASLCAGWLTKRFNPAKLISVGGLITLTGCAGFILFPNLYLMYLWIGVSTFGGGIFCTPYEVYMNAVAPSGQNVGQSTSRYTFAWSLGTAVGPFIFAITTPWQLGFVVCGVIALAAAVGILLLDRYCRQHGLLAGHNGVAYSDEYANEPRHIVIAWFAGFVTTMAIATLRTFEPYKATHIGLSSSAGAYLMALICLSQCAAAALLFWFRRWMYNSRVLLLLGGSAFAGLLGFWYFNSAAGLIASAFLAGFGIGGWYNFFTFHALVDHVKAPSYAAVNETLVGIASVAGPFIAQLTASTQRPGNAFLPAAAVALSATILVPLFLARKPSAHRN